MLYDVGRDGREYNRTRSSAIACHEKMVNKKKERLLSINFVNKWL